jgi:hypothetical protein
MRRSLLVVISACGRIAFDEQAGSRNGGDAGSLPVPLVALDMNDGPGCSCVIGLVMGIMQRAVDRRARPSRSQASGAPRSLSTVSMIS